MRKINFAHKPQGMFFIVDSKMVIVLVFIFSVVTTIDFANWPRDLIVVRSFEQ